MGSLYWQLNDVWAAPTWSTIDAAGQWKVAHYLAVRGTASTTHPIGRAILSTVADKVSIIWVPPLNRPQNDKIKLIALCSSQLSFEFPAEVVFEKDDLGPWEPSGCPVKLTQYNADGLLSKCPSGLLTITISNKDTQINDTSLLLTPREMADHWPQTAGLVKVESVKQAKLVPSAVPRPPFAFERAFEIRIRAQSPEMFVWFVIDPYKHLDGWFSDNAFNMLFAETRIVYYFLRTGQFVSERKLRRAIAIHTLASVQTNREFFEPLNYH